MLGGYGPGRSGWKYRSAKMRYDRAFQAAINGRGVQTIPPAESFRRVCLVRSYVGKQRAFDMGNLVGGFKPLLDVLVKAGVLVDDSPTWCQVWYWQHKLTGDTIPAKGYVDVIIEEQVPEYEMA